MLAGNIGIVSAMSSVILSFVNIRGGDDTLPLLGVLLVGLASLVALSSSQWVDRYVCRGISWALNRFTEINAWDYAPLLHLREDYGVSDLRVQPGEWLAGRTLGDAGFTKEGILVLWGRSRGLDRKHTRELRAGRRH